MNNDAIKTLIESGWENRAGVSPSTGGELKPAVEAVLAELDAGRLRVAQKIGGEWVTHQWLKKAVLLSFRLWDNRLMRAATPQEAQSFPQFYDKVPTKFEHMSEA